MDALEQCHGSLMQEEASRKLIEEFGGDTKEEQDLLNTGTEINRNGCTYQTMEAEPVYELLTAIPCMSIVSLSFLSNLQSPAKFLYEFP